VEARRAAGVSQAELARRIGVSDTYISAIETGRKAAPPHVHVQAIAACLRVDEDDLWRVALEDREQRLRDRLAGVPTAARASSRDSHLERVQAGSGAGHPVGVDASGIAKRIEALLPTREDREQFIQSLEVLIRILRETN